MGAVPNGVKRRDKRPREAKAREAKEEDNVEENDKQGRGGEENEEWDGDAGGEPDRLDVPP